MSFSCFGPLALILPAGASPVPLCLNGMHLASRRSAWNFTLLSGPELKFPPQQSYSLLLQQLPFLQVLFALCESFSLLDSNNLSSVTVKLHSNASQDGFPFLFFFFVIVAYVNLLCCLFHIV